MKKGTNSSAFRALDGQAWQDASRPAQRLEFRGTRAECFAFLREHGFTVNHRDGWHKPGWLATVMFDRHGDFIGEVLGWEGSNFIASAWEQGK